MVEVVAKSVEVPHPIEVEFFSKQSNKTTRLINSPDGFSVEGAHRWYEFQFIEPVYLTGLSIETSGYKAWDKFEFEIHHSDQTTHHEKISPEADEFSLKLGKLVTSFRFRPDKRWITKTDIFRVITTGYTLSEFHEFENSLRSIQLREANVSQKETTVAELESRQVALQLENKNTATEVGTLTAQRNELDKRILSISSNIVSEEAVEKDIKSEIENLQKERREIRASIASEETKLSVLTTELRLFPSEIAGFVREGTRNIRTYLILSIPFTAFFVIILWSLFSSSIDLTQLWKKEDGVDVWTIFLTRIPFVLVAIALIEACGFIVGRLIFEIIKINRQRLEFSKLSIVAKDVVTAAAVDTGMSEEEKFDEETKLKMSLLQEHMKSNSQEEFRYTGSAISSAIIGVSNRLINGKSE